MIRQQGEGQNEDILTAAIHWNGFLMEVHLSTQICEQNLTLFTIINIKT